MNANHVESKFAMMGARFKVNVVPAQRQSRDYAVDIRQDRRGVGAGVPLGVEVGEGRLWLVGVVGAC